MEKRVGELVLKNNYVQTEVLSIEAENGVDKMLGHIQSIRLLEEKGLLDREIEFLPDEHVLDQRLHSHHWLTRPELSVLLAYSKMDLYQQILDSDLPDDKFLQPELFGYFPNLLERKYANEVANHPLRREIISTCVTNQLIGTMGSSFVLRLGELAMVSATDIVRAFLVAEQVLGARDLISFVRDLDNKMPAVAQQEQLKKIAHSVESCTLWLLRNRPAPIELKSTCDFFRKGLNGLKKYLVRHLDILGPEQEIHSAPPGLDKTSRNSLAIVPATAWGCDVTDIADRLDVSIAKTAAVYFELQTTLGLDRLREAVSRLPANDHWNQRAGYTLAETLRITHSAITGAVLSSNGGASTARSLKTWREHHVSSIANVDQMKKELDQLETPDFAMLSVMINGLARLADPVN